MLYAISYGLISVIAGLFTGAFIHEGKGTR